MFAEMCLFNDASHTNQYIYIYIYITEAGKNRLGSKRKSEKEGQREAD